MCALLTDDRCEGCKIKPQRSDGLCWECYEKRALARELRRRAHARGSDDNPARAQHHTGQQ
jgi:hypothetical protein